MPSCGRREMQPAPAVRYATGPPSPWGCDEFEVKASSCFETQHITKPE